MPELVEVEHRADRLDPPTQDANCQQGVSAEDATGRDPSPCTVMIDIVDLASLRFSVLEAAVIRGYALEFTDS